MSNHEEKFICKKCLQHKSLQYFSVWDEDRDNNEQACDGCLKRIAARNRAWDAKCLPPSSKTPILTNLAITKKAKASVVTRRRIDDIKEAMQLKRDIGLDI